MKISILHSSKLSLQKLVVIATLLILAFLSSSAWAETTDLGCEHPFIDVVDHWAEESICFLYNQGVVEGHSERNFLPSEEITRAEFLKISLLNLGYTVYAVQAASFPDVNPGDWYYQYVTFAKSKGFIQGYPDGSFHPNTPITRAEAVVLITQIAGIIAYDISSTLTGFSDVNWDDWFAVAIAVATQYEIVEGYGDGSFRPHNELSRAEATVIAQNVWNALY